MVLGQGVEESGRDRHDARRPPGIDVGFRCDDGDRTSLAIAVGDSQLRPDDTAELQRAGRAHDAGSFSGSKGLSPSSSNHDCGSRRAHDRLQSIAAADLSTS
jgi:hypothetical protein